MNTKPLILIGLIAVGGYLYLSKSKQQQDENLLNYGGGSSIPFQDSPIILPSQEPMNLSNLTSFLNDDTSTTPLYTSQYQKDTSTNPKLSYLANKLNEKLGSNVYEARGNEININKNIKGKSKYTAQHILEKSAINFVGHEGGYSSVKGGVGYVNPKYYKEKARYTEAVNKATQPLRTLNKISNVKKKYKEELKIIRNVLEVPKIIKGG